MKTLKTHLLINGQEIPLNEFVNRFFASTILGMVSCLKGVEDVHSIEVRIEVGEEISTLA